MDKDYDVYSIGNPLMDILAQVEDNFLHDIGVNKGIMHLIDTQRRQMLLEKLKDPINAPGGSAANTIIHAADFGLNVIYSGAVGSDTIGDGFIKGMLERNCTVHAPRKSLPTGTSIILITPDAERTQNTYLGACQQYSIEDVDEEAIAKSRYIYFTGYMWDTESQKEALEHAIKVAKLNETKIVFDVADPFAVNRSTEDFKRIITQDVDFILANREEARTLTQKDEISEMIEYLRAHVEEGVIKDGGNGSYLFDQDNIYHVAADKVNAIDTTGAGDIYASGILYGLAKGYDLQRTGRIASNVAAQLVQIIGARLQNSMREKVDLI
ncbi:MAG: adenosine kinase [Candidatus Kariarchaeaceae archaeon]